MKLRLLKAAAATAIAAVAVLAVPTAANAETDYPPTVGVGDGVTVVAGSTASVPFSGFEPSEPVTFFLSGENASAASLAFVKFAYEENVNLGTREADASGAVTARVVLPANATGTYTLVADGATSGDTATTITVTTAGGGAGTGTGTGTGSDTGSNSNVIAETGGDSGALLGIWVGGGALLLAGASLAVASTVRRNRSAGAAA
jgi:hypothetical protein